MTEPTKQQLEIIKKRFKERDKNKDGLITRDELNKVLGDFYSKDEVDELFDKIDKNKDQKIDWNEFLKFNFN